MTSPKDRVTSEAVREAWDFWLSQHDVSVPEVIKDAVKDSWDFWLSQHDYSVPATIKEAVNEAVTRWLDRHGDDVFGGAIEAAVRNELDRRRT